MKCCHCVACLVSIPEHEPRRVSQARRAARTSQTECNVHAPSRLWASASDRPRTGDYLVRPAR